MRLATFAISIAAMLFATQVSARPDRPPGPRVTVGADLKHLLFDWEPVPRATYYQLFENASGRSGFSPVGPRIPAGRTSAKHPIAVHLQRWQDARYVVAACNAAGCRHSASVFPRDQMLDAIGYFKASNTNAGDSFGAEVQISLDGNTLVVAAPFEASNATGVNGNQSNNSFVNSGAAYVFRRSGGKWRQEAYLKPATNQPNEWFGSGAPFGFDAVAVTANGSRVVVTAPGESYGDTPAAGAAYVYRRAGNGNWMIEARLQSPEPVLGEAFGSSVEISQDGRLIKVTSTRPRDDEGNVHGTTYFYVRPGTTWRHEATVGPVHPVDFCGAVRMSGDAGTLVQYCYNYSSDPADPSRLVTLKRQGSQWVHVPPDIPLENEFTSQYPAISHDGKRLALRLGRLDSPVRIWRWTDDGWVEEATLRSPLPPPDASAGSNDAFGYSLAFNRTGTLLGVTSIRSAATGAGVSPTPTTWGDEMHGAVFLFQRRSSGAWVLRSQIKAPNPDVGDSFGEHLAMSGSGRTLAIGAMTEDSRARGIDGNQRDDSAESAGAVYLY